MIGIIGLLTIALLATGFIDHRPDALVLAGMVIAIATAIYLDDRATRKKLRQMVDEQYPKDKDPND